jgi:hypothetical protein
MDRKTGRWELRDVGRVTISAVPLVSRRGQAARALHEQATKASPPIGATGANQAMQADAARDGAATGGRRLSAVPLRPAPLAIRIAP